MNATTLLLLLIKISLITLMVGLGLGLQLDALKELRHRPWLILRVLLGTCVLVPLAALLLLKLTFTLQMSPGARYGIALMALSPSAPLTLRKAHLQGGDRHLAALLQVAAALLAILSIPLLTDVFRAVYQVEGWDIQPRDVALQVALVQVLPLAIGLVLRRLFPQFGARWALPIQKGAFLVNLSVVALILVMMAPKLFTFLKGNLFAIVVAALMTAIALAIGYLLGGRNAEDRTTTALVTSMRNPGLALLFAITHGKELVGVKLAILTYLLVTILGSIPFLRWSRSRGAPST